MNLRTPLTVIETPEVKSPALYGFVRPRLVLPQGTLAAFTRQELHYIFLHELAHVKRCDMAVNWLISGLRVLHWFNPILWFGFRRMAADREVAADALALSRAPDGDPQPYGQTIIKLLESFTRPAVLPSLVGILEDKQQMKRRIAMIAKFKKTAPWPALAPVLLLALGLVSLTDAKTKNAESKSDATKTAEHSAATLAGPTLRQLQLPEDFNFQEGGVSPDGRYFVGENWPSMRPEIPILSVLELATGTQRHIGTNLLGGIFSPDGKQVVSVPFATNGPPNELALVNVETSERRSFYRNENLKSIWPMDWSPDGRSVLTQLLKKDGTWQIGLLSATEMCMSPSLTPVLGRLREHPQN